MNKEQILQIDIKDLDSPFVRNDLEELPKEWIVELFIRHLKREIKAIEYMEQCRDTKTKRIDSRLKRVLNILEGVDKE